MSDPVTKRNYIDIFDFKKLTTDVLVPKYFPDQDISTLNVGLIGMVSEAEGTVSEDTFRSVSTLLKEFFITKATLPESIYSYAAIYQLSNIIGVPAECTFLLIFDESELAEVFKEASMYAPDKNSNCIYIGKNTTIYVEDIPFTLDYDIEITRKKTKTYTTEYTYSAKYMVTEFHNSISPIVNPYIKIRRNINGYFALEVLMHQCIRTERTETIIDNSSVSYPVVDVTFDGILGGFDAFYREAGDEEWTQMLVRVDNSLPEKDPFCYFKLMDTNVLRLSFSLNDSYFQPEFNSEIKVVTYTTLGEEGNFPSYNGDNITIVKDEESYSYNGSFIVGAAVSSVGAQGGLNSIDLETLRRQVQTQMSTCTILSTDHDLELYFEKFESNNRNIINFIKRRDDLSSRLFTGFMVCKNEDYVYPTNTLDISTNYLYWENPDGGYVYTSDPGRLYTYDGLSNTVVPMYKRGLFEDAVVKDFQYKDLEQNLAKEYFDWLFSVNPSVNPGYMPGDEDWADKWIYSKNSNETFKYFIENLTKTCSDCGYTTYNTGTDEEGYEICPKCGKRNLYTGKHMSEFALTVFDTEEIEDRITKDMFVYSNPFLMTITKHPGLINYYLTIINQKCLLDFTNYNIEVPTQFIITHAYFERPLAREKEYHVTLKVLPSMQWDTEQLIPGITKEEYIPRRSMVGNNYLRIMMVVMDGNAESCFIEMVPTEYDAESDAVTFECKFRVSDHITLGHQVQIDDYSIEELGYVPSVSEDDSVRYTFDETDLTDILVHERQYIDPDDPNYDPSLVVDDDDPTTPTTPSTDNTETDDEDTEEETEEMEDTSGIHGNFTYITNKSTKLINMNNLEVRFVTLYKDIDKEQNGEELTTSDYPNNQLMFNILNYEWTNVYSTFSDRVDLIKPLNMVRSSLYFKDDRLYNITKGDVFIYSSPFVKYTLLQHFNSKGEYTKNENGLTNYEMFNYLIETYYNQYKYFEPVLSTTLREVSYIDLKWYNTYGRSKYYVIGDEENYIDRVNMSIAFYVYLVPGTDQLKADEELKTFIKDEIESLNDDGINDLHISNLIRKIENNFAYVDHLRFIGINGDVSEKGEYSSEEIGYPPEYQSVYSLAKDLSDLTKEDRFAYVPEMLCINKDQIVLILFEEE